MSEQGNNGKKISSTQTILIVGIVVIFAAILGIGALIINKLGAQPGFQVSEAISGVTPSFGTGTVVMDESNVNDMIDEMKRKEAEGRYDVKMTVDWTFPDGKSVGDAYVANAEANTHPVYFDVTLDNGTKIYTSPMLPVGSAVESITLDTPLDAGYYTGVCTYHLLKSEEELTEISNVSIAVRITVKA